MEADSSSLLRSAGNALFAWVLLLQASACGVPGVPADASVADTLDSERVLDDPDPTFTAIERMALRALRYDDDASPPSDPSNRVADDPRARVFGQRLFFEKTFSGALLEGDNDGGDDTLGLTGQSARVSCAGCHVPEGGFVDTRSRHRTISLAAQWTHRRTPTLLETAWVPLYNWDGRRDALWNQAVGVMESDREFNGGRLLVAEQIYRLYRPEYEALFGPITEPLSDTTRFPAMTTDNVGCRYVNGVAALCHGKPGDRAEYDGMSSADQDTVTSITVHAGQVLEAYMRQLRCGAGTFDRWIDGDTSALSRAQQRGASLFVGRAKCVSCHSGPRLTDGAFHNVGLTPKPVAIAFVDTNDRGAFAGLTAALDNDPLGTSGRFSDGDRHVLPTAVSTTHDGAFRTPTLRCISRHPSFMHTAHLTTLDAVIAFFDRGGDTPGGYPGTCEISRLDLTSRERTDLVEFIRALDGPGPAAALLRAP